MRFLGSIPVDHPFIEPLDLSVQVTETFILNADGTLDYSAVATGMTFDEFVLLTSETSGTLSR
jgi:hypothetical protein